jgi:type I restriction enzyme S subunit
VAGNKFLRITDIQDGSVDWARVPYCIAPESKLRSASLADGDIVFARTGATTGKSFLIKSPPSGAVFASYLIRVKPSAAVEPAYLAHFFQSAGYWTQIRKKTQGAAQGGVNASSLSELEIPLPPLDEQRRIAAILDKADALRRKRNRALELLDGLTQSIFLEMFGHPRREARWPRRQLAVVGKVSTGKTPPTSDPEAWGNDVPFLTPGDLESDAAPSRYISHKGASFSKIIEPGAALVCCIGATIGKIDIAVAQSTFNQQINAVQWGALVKPEFGLQALRFCKEDIISRALSTTLPILKKSEFEKIEIIVPPLEDQLRFQQHVEAVRRAKSMLKRARDVDLKLFSSLQHRAFTGQL